MSVFYLLGVILGWFQLFTMVFAYAFSTLNSFNVKLQICKALSSNPDFQETKISTLVFFKIVFIYAMDAMRCRECLNKLK